MILAAGKGKRMQSVVPKVLHKVAGAPLVAHVVDAVREAGITEIVVVVGKNTQNLQEVLGDSCRYVLQEEPLGTGDAVQRALPALAAETQEVVVLCGDTPLLTGATIRKLIEERRRTSAAVAVLTSIVADPSGYGRILRDEEGMVVGIIEEADATPEQQLISEINTGTYVFLREALEATLSRLRPENQQGEYYLTDCIGLLREAKRLVCAVAAPAEETAGVNTRKDLVFAEKILRERQCQRLLEAGVTIIDPATTYVDKGVEVGRDTVIYPFTILEGKTRVGEGCVLGPGTRIVDCAVGDRVTIQYSVVVGSTLGHDCQVGPFSYIRPGTVLAAGVKVGDFVELKKAVIGAGSKVPHLSYIGDAVVGEGVNIGAGTITCNYDGVRKHETRIGDRAFIGSNTNLVAPVTIGEGAVTGAGSTITKDVPPGALAVERARQVIVPNWRKKKEEKDE